MKKKEIKKQEELKIEELDQVTGGAGGYPVDFIGAGLGDNIRLK
jgi:bacteriocin-like protein